MMKKMFIGLLFLSLACNSKPTTVAGLEAFIADESNHVSKSVTTDNGLVVRVSYRPTDLWIAQELGSAHATVDQVTESRGKYKDYLYFILSISRQGTEALEQVASEHYGDLVQTLSFRMDQYVALKTEKKNIPVSNFIMNRTYGSGTSTDILFVFEKNKASGSPWVQFEVEEFGLGTGNLHFRFEMDELEQLPEIQFNN